MSGRLTALKQVLNTLGVDLRNRAESKHSRVQMLIYLSQRAGVNMGYHFG